MSRPMCVLTGMLAAATLGALSPASASAAAVESGTAAVFVEHPDTRLPFERVFDAATASMELAGDDRAFTLELGDGESYLRFAAPPGERLKAGLYPRAQYPEQRADGRPGIDLSYIIGCDRGVAGNFEVKDIDVATDGSIQRLWLVFAASCVNDLSGKVGFGEVRLGEPSSTAAPVVAPALVRWPGADDAGRPGAEVPVTLRATKAGPVGSASIGGPDSGAFTVRHDGCAGRVLALGETCAIRVRFESAGAGTRSAVLRTGGVDRAALEAHAHGGRTGLTMTSDPGEYIGQGQSRAFSPPNAWIRAAGVRNVVRFWVQGSSWWGGLFGAGAEDILAPGPFAGASRGTSRNPAPDLDVFGDGRGCNQLTGAFTVNEARFAEDDTLRTFSADFEQRCENDVSALRGRLEFRAGDTTPAPPWLDEDPGAVGDQPPSGPAVSSDAARRDPPAAVILRRMRISGLAGGLHVIRGRAVGLRLSCPRAAARCRGVVSLVAGGGWVLGRAAFDLAPGASRRAAVRLSARAQRVLQRPRTLSVQVRVRGKGLQAVTRRGVLRASARSRPG